jgi:hypothetical protein
MMGLATSDPDVGQFVFNTDTKQLLWDDDGAGGTAPVLVADLTGQKGWRGSEIVVIV